MKVFPPPPRLVDSQDQTPLPPVTRTTIPRQESLEKAALSALDSCSILLLKSIFWAINPFPHEPEPQDGTLGLPLGLLRHRIISPSKDVKIKPC